MLALSEEDRGLIRLIGPYSTRSSYYKKHSNGAEAQFRKSTIYDTTKLEHFMKINLTGGQAITN